MYLSSRRRAHLRMGGFITAAILACSTAAFAVESRAPTDITNGWCTSFVAPTGSDSNSGTMSAPFGTITHAEAVAAPGDVVCVRGGTYHEQVSLRSTGTDAAPIVVSTFPGESAVIDGTGLSIAEHDALLSIDGNVDHVVVAHLAIEHSSGRGVINDGSYNELFDNHIADIAYAGIMTTNWSGPATNNSYDGNEVNNTVQSNDCHVPTDPCKATGGWESAIDNYDEGSAPAGHNVYVNNHIHDNAGEGMTLMDGDTVRANVVNDNFGVEIYLDGVRNVLVDGNVLYESETKYLPFTSNQSYRLLARGIGLADEQAPARSEDNTIVNNRMINVREGINFWNATPNSGLVHDVIEHNTIAGSWDEPIDLDPGVNVDTVIADNTIIPR